MRPFRSSGRKTERPEFGRSYHKKLFYQSGIKQNMTTPLPPDILRRNALRFITAKNNAYFSYEEMLEAVSDNGKLPLSSTTRNELAEFYSMFSFNSTRTKADDNEDAAPVQLQDRQPKRRTQQTQKKSNH